MYATATMIGRLARDIEKRAFQSGTLCCNNALAITNKYKNANGELVEETSFIDFEVVGKMVEVLSVYCKKGDILLVSGRLHQNHYEVKGTGEKRYKIVVKAEQIRLMPNNENHTSASTNTYSAKPKASIPKAKVETIADTDADDEIPF